MNKTKKKKDDENRDDNNVHEYFAIQEVRGGQKNPLRLKHQISPPPGLFFSCSRVTVKIENSVSRLLYKSVFRNSRAVQG